MKNLQWKPYFSTGKGRWHRTALFIDRISGKEVDEIESAFS